MKSKSPDGQLTEISQEMSNKGSWGEREGKLALSLVLQLQCGCRRETAIFEGDASATKGYFRHLHYKKEKSAVRA